MSSPRPAAAAAPLAAPVAELEPIASTSSELLPTPTEPVAEAATTPLSKTAQKRLARRQAYDAEKPLRRAREKLQKKEKAAEKRKLVELGVIERPPPKKANGQPRRPYAARIVIDMGFDDKMSDKEIKSMTSQLSFCYSVNRSSPNPVPLLVTSLDGRLKNRLDTAGRKTYESWRDVEWWEEGYQQLWADAPAEGAPPADSGDEEMKQVATVAIGARKDKPRSRSKREDVVYLTADSPNVLTTLDEGKTYILGGIVDRNRYKLLCYDKANEDGIQHAQLPISEFLPEMTTRKILTVNQVFEIMIKWIETRDWKEALRAVMPQRKYDDGPRLRGGKKTGAADEGGDGEGDGVGDDGEGDYEEADESMHLEADEDGEAEATAASVKAPVEAKPAAE